MILTSILLALGGIGILLYKNFTQLQLITINQSKIMADIQQVLTELADVKASVVLEHEQAATALATLNTTIQELRDIIAAGVGATPEQLDTVLTGLTEVKALVQGIVPDA